mgnify:CR=1 FL=1
MVKIRNNLNSKYTTELDSLDYGDFFELNNTIYQLLYHSDGSLVVKNLETSSTEYMSRTTVVCKLDVTIIIDGYSREE